MESNELATKITRLSLNRRVSMFVLFLTILAVGLIAISRLQLELLPKGFEGDSISIRVHWKSAVPIETMEKIAIPLEEELSTVRGIDSMTASCSSSSASVYLNFKQGADMDVAYREVRDRLDRAKLRFPEDVEYSYIYKMDTSGIPVCMIGMAYDVSPDVDLYDFVNRKIITPLSRIDGIANVDARGLDEKEIIIEIDKDKSEAYDLDIYTLSQKLRGDNFNLASGNVEDGGKKYLLKSTSTYRTVEELRNLPLSTNIILSDIAVLKYEPEEKRYITRVNSKNAMAITLTKESTANTVAVCEQVVTELNRIKEDPDLAEFELHMYLNQGGIVMAQLDTLFSNGKIGAFFAAIILYLFLRRFRITLIITLAIPLCLFMSVAVMYFAGESLNLLTILGLVICVGLLVDNSVVVAENIQRHFLSGMSRRVACIKGVQEIGLAITTATFTTIIVFLPALLVDGQIRFFMMRLALPVVTALIASLAIALVFVPLCVFLTLKRKPLDKSNWSSRFAKTIQTRLSQLYNSTFERFNKWYNYALQYYLKRRIDLGVIFLVLFCLTYFYTFQKVEFSMDEKREESQFNISFRFPSQFNMEDREKYFGEVEEILKSRKDEFELEGYFIRYSSWYGSLEGWLKADRKSKSPSSEVAEKIFKLLPEVPGLKTGYERKGEGEEKQDRKERYYIRLVGPNPIQLEEVADSLKPLFRNLPGVLAMSERQDDTPNEMALVVDRERANSLGVNPTTLAGLVGSALRGSTLPRFQSEGRQIPVRVRFSQEDRAELADLNNFLVPAEDGRFSSVGTLTSPSMLSSPRYIRRTNKSVSHTLTMELEAGREEEARKAIDAAKENIDLPEGISFSSLRRGFDIEDILTGVFALWMSIIFIYMLMAFLFESVLMPLSIVFTIPLAGIGAVWIHYITGVNMDMLGMIGGMLLVGVVVNNGIVLIDYTNRLRRDGHDRTTALLRAAKHRFRPIAITALTTIFGMIPMVLAEAGEMGLSYRSFGLTLIGGMLSASLFTPLVVPVFYTLFDDAQLALTSTLAGVFRRRRTSGLAK